MPPCYIPITNAGLCIFFPTIYSGTFGGMQFTDSDLQEFIAVWKEEFHETITAADARIAATSLMELCSVLVSREEDS
jgi:hypothetical protein